MKKSKQITLTLLSGLAVAATSCSSEKEISEKDPYSEYAYAGKANEPGMVYSHYGSGILTWYLMSRMFNGYGYGRMGGGYYRSQPGYFTRSTPATSGYSNVARRGFGKIGYNASARS
ncbi:MAG TPA: hypothetical protein VFH43_05680 [Candidatus Kapabacteria bacterium]|nr:hypothetical protein [Candidatus Kapabacteria bacterium]